VILDLIDRLDTVRSAAIADNDLFRRVTTDGKYIRWENKVEISAGEGFQLAKKARPKTLCALPKTIHRRHGETLPENGPSPNREEE
jgi:hypothetical protein